MRQERVFKSALIGWYTETPAFIETSHDGVSELKICVGPGYRVYYTRRGNRLLLLLAGGDKSSQRKDIEMAILLARNYQE